MTDHPAAGVLDRPVFIVGPPRSGTTLLRRTLSRHPDLTVAPETHLLDRWIRAHPGLKTGSRRAFGAFWEEFAPSKHVRKANARPEAVVERLDAWGRWDLRSVVTALLAETAEVHGTPRSGEKVPAYAFHVEELFSWFPDARILWVRRDPRDTSASLLALDQPWATDDLRSGATTWVETERQRARWEDDERCMTVEYERLVREPSDELSRVLGHVQLEAIGPVLEPPDARPGQWHGGQDPKGPVTDSSLGKWRSRLHPGQVGHVEAITDLRSFPAYTTAWRELAPRAKLSFAAGYAQENAREQVKAIWMWIRRGTRG